MRRRDFIALAAGAAAVSPVRSWAQRTTTIPRVGVLWHAADADGEWPYYGCLLDGFEELGHGQRKIELIHRFPDEKPPEKFQSMAARACGARTRRAGGASARCGALCQESATSTIPMVFSVCRRSDPAGQACRELPPSRRQRHGPYQFRPRACRQAA